MPRRLYNQGFILGARGDFDAAVRLFEESLELFRGAGDDTGMARAEWMIVIRDLTAGDLDGTVARAEEAVATWRRVGDHFHLGDGLVWLAVLYARAGRRADARWAILQALELVREIDSPMGVVSVILGLAYVARWEERHEDAMRLIGAAESLRERVGGGAPINFLAGFMGDPEAEARAHLSQEATQRAIKEGRTMSVDAALALAVGDDTTTKAPRDPA